MSLVHATNSHNPHLKSQTLYDFGVSGMRGWIHLVKRAPNDEIRVEVDKGKHYILENGPENIETSENRLTNLIMQILIEFSYSP